MRTTYRSGAWQPVDTPRSPKGTKPPYYGNVAAAAMLGDASRHGGGPVTVTEVALDGKGDGREAAYAAYVGGKLARLLVLNMQTYNTTVDGAGLDELPHPLPERGSRKYTFDLGDLVVVGDDGAGAAAPPREVLVQRLLAGGSDAITGVTWDGWSYNYELDGGRPVRLHNITVGEKVKLSDQGHVTVTLPDSSAAILNIQPATSGAGRVRRGPSCSG